MRFTGKLHTWNEERGFGFIRPTDGGQDIFVHVSALPHPRPTADQVLTFEVGLNAEGKKKATHVRLQALEVAGLAAERARPRNDFGKPAAGRLGRHGNKAATFIITLLAVCAIAFFGHREYERRSTLRSAERLMQIRSNPLAPSAYRCDGRTMCSQMTSCSEALYFLRNCPRTKMDGDRDGVPCENQWCPG